MNDTVWLKLIDNLPAIIAAFASVLTALGVVVVAYFNYRTNVLAKAAVEQSQSNGIKIAEVGTAVNGKMERLLEVSNAKAHAEGMKEEKDEQNVRDTPVKVEIVQQPVPVTVVKEGE